MSADLLREAATAMREEAQMVCRPYARAERVAEAVADWLEDALEAHLSSRPGNYPSYLGALAVARAYLGGAS